MKTEQYQIRVNDKTVTTSIWLVPEEYDAALIIAHGAGQDMHSAFISYLHQCIAEQNILTVKFNFPYLEQGRKSPDSPKVLTATWLKIIDCVLTETQLSSDQIFLSGKSMGGRYASIIAAEQSPSFAGLILFGYPLHAPGKPEKPRAEHFAKITCPSLFFQGTRDSLCQLEKLRFFLKPLHPEPSLHIIEGGDHSFKTLKRMTRSEHSVWQEISDAATAWIKLQL